MKIFKVTELSSFSLGEQAQEDAEQIQNVLGMEFSTIHNYSINQWLNEAPYCYKVNCFQCETPQEIFHMDWDAITCSECKAIIDNPYQI